LFVEILLIAQATGLLKMGTVSLDGTKIKASASKHKALSWEHANRIEAQLKAEVAELMCLAEQADTQASPEQMDIPLELARRAERLHVTAAAEKEITQRAQERFAREQAEYERKRAQREAYAKQTGKKPRGKEPKAAAPGPRAKDQVNVTDEESRIMPSASGGFEQSFNAQAGVGAPGRTSRGDGQGRGAVGRHRLPQRGQR